MKTTLSTFVCFLIVGQVMAQQKDSTTNPLRWSGYLETYYAYDMGEPGDHERPNFFYNYNRHNEVNLNLGFVKANYSKENVRGNLGLMAGTYANANLAAEPGTLRNVFEANAGVKISKKKNLWVDAGIFPSHIGFESAIGKDCWNVTRSILAENSPYYESGAKISYTSNSGRWFLSGLVLNGWQHIQRPDGNNKPAIGTQVTFKPNKNITLNSSTFIGDESPDSLSRLRLFHNFYGVFNLHKNFSATVGFDVGMQEYPAYVIDFHLWHASVLILRMKLNEKFFIAARGEYYSDKYGVIVSNWSTNDFPPLSYSLNLDVVISENAMWRIEARGMESMENIFEIDGRPSNTNAFFTTALAVSF